MMQRIIYQKKLYERNFVINFFITNIFIIFNLNINLKKILNMKKVLFVIILIMSISFSNFTFGQLPPSESSKDLSLNMTSVPQSSPYNENDDFEDYKHWQKKGVNNIVGGLVFGGIGATLLAFQPSPYVNYDTSTRFWCGVTFCTLGGIEFILGIAYLGHASVLLSKEKKISLTPAKQNIGIAINF